MISFREVTRGDSYNEKCDVFSFGLVIYDVIFETLQHYKKEIGNVEHIVATNASFRPVAPNRMLTHEEQKAFALAQQCWGHNPTERPSFEAICSELELL